MSTHAPSGMTPGWWLFLIIAIGIGIWAISQEGNINCAAPEHYFDDACAEFRKTH